MATIETRRNADGTTSYRARVRVRGHRPESATFARRTDAKTWAKGIEAAIAEGRRLPTIEARRHTLGELIDRYIRDVVPQKSPTAVKQVPQLEWWRAELGDVIVADVGRAMISEARDKLAALGDASLFEVVVASGEPEGPPRLKPHPGGYLAAAKRLGVPPEECLVIGDRDDADGAAARAAGMSFRLV